MCKDIFVEPKWPNIMSSSDMCYEKKRKSRMRAGEKAGLSPEETLQQKGNEMSRLYKRACSGHREGRAQRLWDLPMLPHSRHGHEDRAYECRDKKARPGVCRACRQ